VEVRKITEFDIRRSTTSAKQRVQVITCHRCGASDQMADHNVSLMPFEPVAKYFRRKGWDVGHRRQGHVCPGCQKRDKAAARARYKAKEPPMRVPAQVPASALTLVATPALPVVAESPRVMSREERRIVFEKLNELYVNERTGYAPGWTDEKVAKDLGTPRAWVAQVRDEMFGPEGTNPEIRELLTEAREVLSAMRSEELKHRRNVEIAFSGLRDVSARADAIEKKIIAIEKQVGIRP